MDFEEFKEGYSKEHHFFLSELFEKSSIERGFVIEIFRIAEHNMNLIMMFRSMSTPEDLDEDAEIKFEVEMDSPRRFLMLISASFLREQLKLFDNFSKLDFYKTFKQTISGNDLKFLELLEDEAHKFDQGTGFLLDVLIPLRNSIFHYYDANRNKEVESWVDSIMSDEKDIKPRYQTISLNNHKFGPGDEYEEYLFSKHLFIGVGGKPFQLGFVKIPKIQGAFIELAHLLTKFLIKRNKIPKRIFGWHMKYIQGFKKE